MSGRTRDANSRKVIRFAGIMVVCVTFGAFMSQLVARLVIGDSIDSTAYLMDGALAGAAWGTVLGFLRQWSWVIGLGIAGMVVFALLYHRFIVALVGI